MTLQAATMGGTTLRLQRAEAWVLAAVRAAAGWLYAATGSPRLADVAGVSTEDLILRFQKGQPRAFEALYDRYKDYIYRVAFSALRNQAEAEDAVQETFLDLLKALPTYDIHGPARFETWLYRVALNRARMRLRRKRPPSAAWEDLEAGLDRLPVSDGETAGPRPQQGLVGAGPELAVINRETAAALWRAVDQLPDTHRLPVILRYREGFSYEEIAEALGVQLGTVKSRLYNAHKKLQRFVGTMGD